MTNENLCKCGLPAKYGKDCWKSKEEFIAHKERMLALPFPEGTLCSCGQPATCRRGNNYEPSCPSDEEHDAYRNSIPIPEGTLCSCGQPATHRIYGQPSCYQQGEQKGQAAHTDRNNAETTRRNNAIWARGAPRKDITSSKQIGWHHGKSCTCPDCDPN